MRGKIVVFITFQLSVGPIVDALSFSGAIQLVLAKLEPPDKKCPCAQDLMLIRFKYLATANLHIWEFCITLQIKNLAVMVVVGQVRFPNSQEGQGT